MIDSLWFGYGFSCALVVAIIFLVAVVIFVHGTKSLGRARLPPGPSSWPVIGHLHMLGALPHQSFYNLSKQYGPLMYLSLGQVPTVVASSDAIAKEFLQRHDLIFASRPQTAAAKHLHYNGAGFSLTPYGAHFTTVKKICVEKLLAAKKLEFFRNIRQEEVFSMVQYVWQKSRNNKHIDVPVMLSSLLNNTMHRMLHGKRLIDKGKENSAAALAHKDLIDQYVALHGVFNLGDYFPLLRPFDFQGHERRMRKLMKTIDAFLEDIIQEHRKRRHQTHERIEEDNDFLDVLLSISESGIHELSYVNVKAILLELLTGATDTSAATIEWALSELLRHPEIMQTLQDELDRKVGRERMVQESDINQLEYLQAVVKETLRMYPVAPLMLPHQSTQAIQVNGFHIPANATLFVNVWAIGRDPCVWSRAWDFYPERFLGKSTDVGGQNFKLIPFGSGRRACPGRPFAMSMVPFTLASLLQSFEWSLPRNERAEELDMTESFKIVLHKAIPLIAVAKPRLSHHLYQSN